MRKLAVIGLGHVGEGGLVLGFRCALCAPDEPGQLAAVHGDVGPGGQQIAQDDVGGDLIAHEGRCAADGGAHDHSTHGAGGSVGVGHVAWSLRERPE